MEQAWKQGLIICASAGNEGPEPRTIASPRIDPVIITVGSADDKNSADFSNYTVAEYSSRAPMATPVCSGIAALMLEADESLTPDDLKKILVQSARPLTDGKAHDQGAGMVDAEKALLAIKSSKGVMPSLKK